MTNLKYLFLASFLLFITTSCQHNKSLALFDGETLNGWEGSDTAFRVENGAIVGGNLEKGLEESFYLGTTQEYSDFELKLSVKLVHNNLEGNAGISFRGQRVEDSNRVASYQADIGYINPDVVVHCSDYKPSDMVNPFSLWGTLIDECRADLSRYPEPEYYPAVILKMADRDIIHDIIKPYDWNDIQVTARGNEIEIKTNGVTTVKYIETGDVPSSGYIFLQAHQGKPYEVHYKNIYIRKLD